MVLLSGTEEANYKKSGSKKKYIDKTMFERRSCFKLYEGKNRMVRLWHMHRALILGWQIPPEIKPRAQYVELAIPSAQEVLNEPPLPLPEAEPVELDEEQQEYMQDKWTVTASQQPERLMRAVRVGSLISIFWLTVDSAKSGCVAARSSFADPQGQPFAAVYCADVGCRVGGRAR